MMRLRSSVVSSASRAAKVDLAAAWAALVAVCLRVARAADVPRAVSVLRAAREVQHLRALVSESSQSNKTGGPISGSPVFFINSRP